MFRCRRRARTSPPSTDSARRWLRPGRRRTASSTTSAPWFATLSGCATLQSDGQSVRVLSRSIPLRCIQPNQPTDRGPSFNQSTVPGVEECAESLARHSTSNDQHPRDSPRAGDLFGQSRRSLFRPWSWGGRLVRFRRKIEGTLPPPLSPPDRSPGASLAALAHR